MVRSGGTPASSFACGYDDIKDWGQLDGRPVIDVVFDGGQDAVDLQLGILLAGRYVRPADDARRGEPRFRRWSEANLAALRREAERLIATNEAAIDTPARA